MANIFILINLQFHFFFQTFYLSQNELKVILQENAELVKKIQNIGLGKDDSISIDHSRL